MQFEDLTVRGARVYFDVGLETYPMLATRLNSESEFNLESHIGYSCL